MGAAAADINLTLVDPSDQRTLVTPKITVDQLARMIEMGVVEQRPSWELLDGMIVRVDKSGEGQDILDVSPAHVYSVEQLQQIEQQLREGGCHMRVQLPLALPPYDVPEPDGCVVLADIDRYAKRHPRAEETLCVIEVAESSFLTDWRYKLRLYARFGLPMYVILNLRSREAEVYTDPVRDDCRYGRSIRLSETDLLKLPRAHGEALPVSVGKLLPPCPEDPQAPRAYVEWRTDANGRWRDAFHMLGYALVTQAHDNVLKRLDSRMSEEQRQLSSKAITHALAEFLAIVDGRSFRPSGVEYVLSARVVSEDEPGKVIEEIELAPNGQEDVCMGFWYWFEDRNFRI